MEENEEFDSDFSTEDIPISEGFWNYMENYWHNNREFPESTESSLNKKADLIGGKVPASQLPSYVDDVLEFDSFENLPNPGEKGKIYLITNNNSQFRWGGSGYIQLNSDEFLMTTNTEQVVNGTKWFETSGGDNWSNTTLRILSNDGSNPTLAFYKGGTNIAGFNYDGGTFHFNNNGNVTDYSMIRVGGIYKDGSDNTKILLAGGADKPVSDFALANDLNTVHKIDTQGFLNNASDTHTNKSWFDYNWAGQGKLGSVINVSGFGGVVQKYNTEIFAAYNSNYAAIRSKNGDINTWNEPMVLWHDKNFNPGNYILKSGDTMTGVLNLKNLNSPTLNGAQIINAANPSELYVGNPSVTNVYFESGDNNLLHNRAGYGVGAIWDVHNLSPVTTNTAQQIIGKKEFVGATDNSYTGAGIMINGNGNTDTVYPTLSFHQPTLYAGTISYRNDSEFSFMNINGDSYKSVKAYGYIKDGSDNNYLLLGGGGHKLTSDFATSASLNNYLPLSGGTLSGGGRIDQFGNIIVQQNNNGGNATGMFWESLDNTQRIAGFGIFTADGQFGQAYMGWGATPWDVATSLAVADNLFTYKNNQVWHAGIFNPNDKVSRSGDTMTGGLNIYSNGALGKWKGADNNTNYLIWRNHPDTKDIAYIGADGNSAASGGIGDGFAIVAPSGDIQFIANNNLRLKSGLGNIRAESRLIANYQGSTSGQNLGSGGIGNTLELRNYDAYGTNFWTNDNGSGFIQQQRFDGNQQAYDLSLQPLGGKLLYGDSEVATTSQLFKNLIFTSDLDLVSESGIYRQEIPSSNYGYTTTLNLNSSDGRQQLTIERTGGGMKFRGTNTGSGNGGWSTWKDVIHSGNFSDYLNGSSQLNSKVTNLENVTGIGFSSGNADLPPYFYHPINGYRFLATQTWVGQQGYLTSANLNGYATEAWVSSNIPTQTLSTNDENNLGQALTLSNGNSVLITNNFVGCRDGSRNPNDVKPNSSGKRVRFDFANASSVKGSGNYAGVMTYAPWDGTTASTGDSSYQLAFANQTGINGQGIPMLKIRKGIDEKWSSDWYKMWSEGDFSQSDINKWNNIANTAATQSWVQSQNYAPYDFVEAKIDELKGEIVDPAPAFAIKNEFTTVILTDKHSGNPLELEGELIPESFISIINLSKNTVDLNRDGKTIDRIYEHETSEYYITKEGRLIKKGTYKNAQVLI